MGRGRASALKVYAHTYKCQKINFFKYISVIHQNKRLESLMNKQKSILKNAEVMAKKPWKIPLSAILTFFDSFFGHNFCIFQYFAKRIFVAQNWNEVRC